MFRIKYKPHAEVAELADALGSGLSGRKLVRVQVPPSALLRIPAGRQVSCFKQPFFNGVRKAGKLDNKLFEWTSRSINNRGGLIVLL